jgi:predicted ester cyclase
MAWLRLPVALLVVGLAFASLTQAQSGKVSPSDRIQAANEQLLNQGNMDKFEKFFSPDYVNHLFQDERGPEPVRRFVKDLRTAFPDLRVDVEILLEQGDMVAWRRTHRGTFKADLPGMKATGREVVWHAVVISRMKDGRIVEEWGLGNFEDQVQK